MDSKLDKLKKEAKRLNIELDANETIADLEAKIAMNKATFKLDKNELVLDPGTSAKVRRKPVKNINFTRRIDREAKKNG
jgi:hypothetical protein